MKKIVVLLLSVLLLAGVTGCSKAPEDPGPPPESVIRPGSQPGTGAASSADTLTGAVTAVTGGVTFQVDMFDNAAAETMMGYLSGSPMTFPVYTYEEAAGFISQRVRGSYTRDDEVTVQDAKCGELYLFSDGQLRLYFKDAPGVNITATPVGRFQNAEAVTKAVQDDYANNEGDTWGVLVYFSISKNA